MLWKVKPYPTLTGELRQGKTHRIDDQAPEKTFCGKVLANAPGVDIEDSAGTIDCRVCLSAIENRKKWAQWTAEAQLRQKQWEEAQQAREAEQQAWKEWYNTEYLQSSEWKAKRTLVLQRAKHLCEGCGLTRATQVHHLTYKRIGEEMLFDLVALCAQCHERIHGSRHGLSPLAAAGGHQ